MIRDLFFNIMAELSSIFRDPGVLIIMGAATVFYSFVYPLPYSSEVLNQVSLTVIDQDNSALSRQLVRMVDASEMLRVEGRSRNLHRAQTEIGSGRYSVALVIPEDFEKDILHGRKAYVSAYVDATYFLIYRQAMTGLVKTVRTLSAGIQIRRFQAEGWSGDKAMVDRSPLNLISRPLFNPTMGYATYIVPGVLILILQQTMLIGIGMISGTRREQMMAGKNVPRRRGGPLVRIISRTMACLLLYFVHILFIYGVVYQIWDFPMRTGIAMISLFLLPFLLSVILLGQVLAEFFKTRESSIIMVVWSSMIAVLISGFSWPVESMPHFIRAISMLLPSTWAISGGLRLTQMGASFHQVREEWFWMWGLTLLYLLFAWICNSSPRQLGGSWEGKVKISSDFDDIVGNGIGGTDLAQLHEAVDREFLNLNEREHSVRSVMAKMESVFIRKLAEFHHE
ncbi:MAG: ABC transporter permease [Desulfamplus sp.]|nr:ABC transporter permease [Desulfamplus sp.]